MWYSITISVLYTIVVVCFFADCSRFIAWGHKDYFSIILFVVLSVFWPLYVLYIIYSWREAKKETKKCSTSY